MEIFTIKNNLIEALQELYQCPDEYPLIERESSERAVVFRLALKMLPKFPHPFFIDCEYNKFGVLPKTVDGRKGINLPDIIVHSRKPDNKNNLLVIEAKLACRGSNSGCINDYEKLCGFTSDPQYKYRVGAHLNICAKKAIIAWYEYGRPVEVTYLLYKDKELKVSDTRFKAAFQKRTTARRSYDYNILGIYTGKPAN